MAQNTRVIKKYPNRRLYDTEISSYITLEEVRQLVLDGEIFEVRDAKTNDDLTRSVLLQIIAEHEQQGAPMFSVPLLTQIIRFYGDALQGLMGPYLERSMQVFLEQQQQFRKQLHSMVGQTPWAMFNELTSRNMELWQNLQRSLVESVHASGVGNGNGSQQARPSAGRTDATGNHAGGAPPPSGGARGSHTKPTTR